MSITSGLPKWRLLPFHGTGTQITCNSFCSAFNRPRNSIELASVCSCSHARISFYHNGNFMVVVGIINGILCYKFLLWNFLAQWEWQKPWQLWFSPWNICYECNLGRDQLKRKRQSSLIKVKLRGDSFWPKASIMSAYLAQSVFHKRSIMFK